MAAAASTVGRAESRVDKSMTTEFWVTTQTVTRQATMTGPPPWIAQQALPGFLAALSDEYCFGEDGAVQAWCDALGAEHKDLRQVLRPYEAVVCESSYPLDAIVALQTEWGLGEDSVMDFLKRKRCTSESSDLPLLFSDRDDRGEDRPSAVVSPVDSASPSSVTIEVASDTSRPLKKATSKRKVTSPGGEVTKSPSKRDESKTVCTRSATSSRTPAPDGDVSKGPSKRTKSRSKGSPDMDAITSSTSVSRTVSQPLTKPGKISTGGMDAITRTGSVSRIPSPSNPLSKPGKVSTGGKARKASKEPSLRPRTKVCELGSMCKNRIRSHLDRKAHPFDPDYAELCEKSGIDPEEPCLKALFEWVDVDASGKISAEELRQAVPLLSALFDEKVDVSQAAWERLDDDGNGAINFSEFASWAGPRLGLPLGVKHLFSGRATNESHGCAILGCPCEAFIPRVAISETDASLVGPEALASPTFGLTTCKCGHKALAHYMALGADAEGEVPYPLYWDTRDSSHGEFNALVPMDSVNVELFQKLLNISYRNIFTRDRKKHNPHAPNVPKGFEVVRALRSENSKSWREYGVRRAELLKRCESSAVPMYSDIISAKAWMEFGEALADRLKPEINEWYLFHGTNTQAAEQICSHDFKFSLSGGNTGSLYGRGIYMAESITKADEYSKADSDGMHAVLLCRALGGLVRYTDELEPDAEELLSSCIEGKYDCVLGDRTACKGTFREFVFFDTEDIFAEYIIHYRRCV